MKSVISFISLSVHLKPANKMAVYRPNQKQYVAKATGLAYKE
jgi:hypothetical protein